MRASIEREDFSVRLQQALRNNGYAPESPTQLAREFNIRFSGRPITVHAARKWLVGEAIPTQEKLRTLAMWLSVATEWLRFGGEANQEAENAARNNSHFDTADVKLIADLQQLDEKYREVAREFMRMLVRINARK